MDSGEAKKILALYRPGDTNSPDPRMAEALAMARKDTQLAQWFGQHCAALVQLPPQAPVFKPERVAPPPSAEEEQPAPKPLNKFALAVLGLIALATLGVIWWNVFPPPPQNNFISYRDRMARLVQRSYPMKTALTDQAQLREYFRTNSGLSDFSLPTRLERLPGKGGAVFTWHSQPVTLLGLDAGANTSLYLFVVRRSVFPNPPAGAPELMQVGNLMTMAWTQGTNTYLLTGSVDEATMRSFLEPGSGAVLGMQDGR